MNRNNQVATSKGNGPCWEPPLTSYTYTGDPEIPGNTKSWGSRLLNSSHLGLPDTARAVSSERKKKKKPNNQPSYDSMSGKELSKNPEKHIHTLPGEGEEKAVN